MQPDLAKRSGRDGQPNCARRVGNSDSPRRDRQHTVSYAREGLSRAARMLFVFACLSLVTACGDSPPPDGGDTGGDTGGDSGGNGGGSDGGNTSCSATAPCPPPCPPDTSGIQKQYDDALAKLNAELARELDSADFYESNAEAPIKSKYDTDLATNDSNLAQGLITKDAWSAKLKQIRDEYFELSGVIADEASRMRSDAQKAYNGKKNDLNDKRDADIAALEAACAGSNSSSQGSNSMTPVTDQNHTIGMCDPSKGVCTPI